MSIRRRLRVTVDFKLPVNEIDYPVVGDTGPCIGILLLLSVFPQCRIGDFHNKTYFGRRRVMVFIVLPPTGNNKDVRLRLRAVFKRHCYLLPKVEVIPKGDF